jgi:hypothetical protein
MSTQRNIPLAEQRLQLRRQLLAQRQLITQQIERAPGAKNGYPRSMTMRLLTQRPALVAKLLTGIATLLIGARMISAIRTTLSLARVVQSVSKTRYYKKPASVPTSQAAVHTAKH